MKHTYPTKLLKLTIQNTQIFGDEITVDFRTADSVRPSASDNDDVLRAYKLKGSTYNQVIMALTGLNASGKTTLLQVISMVLQILFDGASINQENFRPILTKLLRNNGDPIHPQFLPLEWIIYFVHNNQLYQLDSRISIRQFRPGKEGIQMGEAFYFVDEKLMVKPFRAEGKEKLLSFDGIDDIHIFEQEKERKNPYFRDTISIVSGQLWLGREGEHHVYSYLPLNDMNVAAWLGKAEPRIVQCFDPNVEEVRTLIPDGGVVPEFRVQFKNQKNSQYGGKSRALGQFLSSGTIKGITLMQGILGALSSGGYLIVDEIENHFNRKIVEWILSLFENRKTNPRGACLIFSTHYPELLDCLKRSDNIYIMRKSEGIATALRYSDAPRRKDLLKSKAFLYNIIGGTAPKLVDIRNANRWIESIVHIDENK